jgi:hypothetical protein
MKACFPMRSILFRTILVSCLGFSAFAGPIQLVTPRTPGLAASPGGNGDSGPAILSPDGRYVLFSSAANNLALTPGGSPIPMLLPARVNVYLRDRTNSTTTLVSVNLSGTGGGNGDSFATGISSNGQYVLFESSASDLANGDTNNATDVFVRDLVNGTNFLVSVSTNGAFGNGSSGSASITPDGHYVAFVSAASNLVADDSNGIQDIFVRDLQAGTTVLASPGAQSTWLSAGSASAAPVITPDGRFVAFYSSATNLVVGNTNIGDIYVRNLIAGITTWASAPARAQLNAFLGTSNGVCFCPKISADGSLIAYEVTATAYTKSAGVVLRYNLASLQTDVVNTNANAPFGPYEDMRTLDMSSDGRFVASTVNTDTNGVNTLVYLWDAQTGTNLLVSADVNDAVSVSGSSYAPLLDAAGRYVAFLSNTTNLTTNVLSGECHLYCRDTLAGSTVLLDADANGVGVGVNPEIGPAWSQDASSIVFECANTGDRNHYQDIFVYDLASGIAELVTAQDPSISTGTPNGPSFFTTAAAVNFNGRYVAFASEADNLTANDTNGIRDVFVRDLILGTNILISADTNGLPADGFSSEASISGDGRYVVFSSSADNLVSGDTNNTTDVFERDLQTGTTILVSANMDGSGLGNTNSYSPIISSDGRFVLFRRRARNQYVGTFGNRLENLFLRDLELATNYALTAASVSPGVTFAAMTPDGHYVAFIGKIAGSYSAYLYVWDSQLAALVYTNTSSGLAQVAISPDGQRVAYSTSSGLFLVDLANPANNATIGSGTSNSFSTQWGWNFSADGNLLAFETSANIATPDSGGNFDVYLYDVLAKTNYLVSRNLAGTGPGDAASVSPVISPDSRFIAYRSAADNLVPGDSNGVPDVFIYDRTSGATTLLSASQFGNRSSDNRSLLPIFSGDGQTLVFQSAASDLVGTNDWNRTSDLFAFNLYSGGLIPTFYVQLGAAGSGQNPTLIWPVLAGKTYQVQFKNNLSDPVWQTLPGSVSILGGTAYFTDPTPFAGQRFYQIVGY